MSKTLAFQKLFIKMVWLKPTLLKLIKLFEEQPHLWKIGHPQYENEELKEAAYSEIASNLGVKPEEVPIKWDQLKSQFNEENSKVVNSQGSYQSHWFGFESMAFLKENEILLEAQSSKELEPVICRSCMVEEPEMYDMFSSQIEEDLSVTIVYKLLTGIEISKNDNYSKSICKECFAWVEEFYKFRKRANSVQLLLDTPVDQLESTSDKNEALIKDEIKIEESIPLEVTIDENDNAFEQEIALISPQPTAERNAKPSPIKSNNEKYQCKICYKTFDKRDKLNIHLFIHKNRYLCTVCGIEFKSRLAYRSHHLIHTGEKPYVCKICSKAFRQATTLKFHMKLHTGKDIECQQCGHMFARSTDLRIHMLHSHSDNQPIYSCEECNKSYTNPVSLKNHKSVVHEGVRHVCEICDKVVTTKMALRRHKAIHSNVLPFNCENCSKGFARLDNLKQHIRAHHSNQT